MAEPKKQKVGKANHKLLSQNHRFARDQNANEALKSATSFNEPKNMQISGISSLSFGCFSD